MNTRRIRTLFVSDVHLGFRHSHPTKFLSTIKQFAPETLIIAGDFIDGRRLRHRWTWNKEFDQVFGHLRSLVRHGCKIAYLPGNHDEFLRKPENQSLDLFQISNELDYELLFGGTVSILHGDLYDRTEVEKTIGSRFGCCSYDLIVRLHSWINQLARRIGFRRLDLCQIIKSYLWQAHRHIRTFREKLCRHARFKNHSGVVCGHIHFPQMKIDDQLLYLNTGDWVENASYVLETIDGGLELYNHGGLIARQSREELEQQLPMPQPSDKRISTAPNLVGQTQQNENWASELQHQILNYH